MDEKLKEFTKEWFRFYERRFTLTFIALAILVGLIGSLVSVHYSFILNYFGIGILHHIVLFIIFAGIFIWIFLSLKDSIKLQSKAMDTTSNQKSKHVDKIAKEEIKKAKESKSKFLWPAID